MNINFCCELNANDGNWMHFRFFRLFFWSILARTQKNGMVLHYNRLHLIVQSIQFIYMYKQFLLLPLFIPHTHICVCSSLNFLNLFCVCASFQLQYAVQRQNSWVWMHPVHKMIMIIIMMCSGVSCKQLCFFNTLSNG